MWVIFFDNFCWHDFEFHVNIFLLVQGFVQIEIFDVKDEESGMWG